MTLVLEERAAVQPRSSARTEVRRFRPDVQGLRAIAILLVVLYHAHVPGIRGGYVGVDVFFVISGYLITGQLVREVSRTGGISLSQFYLRRARRLLPSAVLVILATVAAAWALGPPLLLKKLSIDGMFSALYAVNYRLAAEGVNYQNAGATPSVFQHFWSLAVEEQFYLIWPLLILASVALSRRWWRSNVLPAILIIVVVVSLCISQHTLTTDAPMSYFSLQSRAWEFGVGALVALASGALTELPSLLSRWASWIGLAIVIGTGVLYTDSTPFPGLYALAPVLGTALVIAAGCSGKTGAESLLDKGVMQWLGKVSYPWYLWHWPLLILVPYIWPGVDYSVGVNLGLMAIALVLAAVTYYGVELPLRQLRSGRGGWAPLGVGLPALATVFCLLVGSSAASTIGSPPPVHRPARAHGAAPTDPFSSTLTSGPVDPSVSQAVSDTPPYPADCIVSYDATTSPTCLIDTSGSATNAPITSNRVVLLGDSHAGEWYPDVYGIARQEGWDTEVLNKVGCPLANITVGDATSTGSYTQCTQWRANVLTRLEGEARPKIIFIASLNDYTSDNATLARGWSQTIRQLERIGAPIVYLDDTPYPNFDVPTCVSGALDDWNRSAFSRSTAFHAEPLMTGTPASHGLAARVDVNGDLCPASDVKCPAVLDGYLLYRDSSHPTNTAMTQLLPVVQSQLRPLLSKVER